MLHSCCHKSFIAFCSQYVQFPLYCFQIESLPELSLASSQATVTKLITINFFYCAQTPPQSRMFAITCNPLEVEEADAPSTNSEMGCSSNSANLWLAMKVVWLKIINYFEDESFVQLLSCLEEKCFAERDVHKVNIDEDKRHHEVDLDAPLKLCSQEQFHCNAVTFYLKVEQERSASSNRRNAFDVKSTASQVFFFYHPPRSKFSTLSASNKKSIRSGLKSDHMRQVNSAMSTSMEAHSVSSKQWFLTLNEAHQEVFIWKDGMLKDQSSGGPVEEVEVTGGAEKTDTVTY